MRIAYLCTDFGIPIHGSKGASIHVRELTQALRSLGHEVLILTPRRGGEPPSDFTIPVVELPLDPADARVYDLLRDDPAAGPAAAKEVRSSLYATSLRGRALPILRDFAPDAIYERYALLGTAGAALARELDIRHVLEVNAPLSVEQAAHRGLVYAATAEAIERDILAAADEVIAVSRPLGEWLVATGVARDRVTVLPNAVDIERFAANDGRDAMRARLGIAPAEPVVAFVGTLKAWHGTGTLVRAIAALHRRLPVGIAPPWLLIVGEGPERATLAALAAQEGILARTLFTGAVPHGEMPAYLAAMDVAVAPYDRAEPFYFSPLKLFEYLAAGRPVVAAAIGQIADCLRHGETGLLYPPGDAAALAEAIAALLTHPDRAAALAGAGQEYVRSHHTWAGNARAVVELARVADVSPAPISKVA